MVMINCIIKHQIKNMMIMKKEYVDLFDMPSLESDEEEVKEEKGLQIFISNKLLTRLPILLAQIKVGNNSCKLKNEI